jgi:hypothetical protein
MKNLKNILIKGLTFSMLVTGALMGFSQTASNPCPNKYGNDTALAKEKLSLFSQYYQSKDLVTAYQYWRYLFDNAPCIQKRVTFNGPRVAKTYLSHLRKTNDSMYKIRKAGIIDTILMVYPKRIELYGREGYVKGKWASDWAKLKPKERQQALLMFEESVAMEGNKTAYTVPMGYLKTAIKEHKKKKYTLDSLYLLYFQLMDITEYNLVNSKKAAKWKATEAFMNKVMKPYLNCEKVEEYFKPKVEAAPNDTALLKKVAGLLITVKCEKSIFFLGLAEKIYALDPTPESALTIAVGRHAHKEYKSAAEWYTKALGSAKDDSTKAKLHMKIAHIHSAYLNSISQAHKAATEALHLNSSLAGAYLIKSKYIGSLVGACSGDKIDGLSAYWAAADAAIKARTLGQAQGNEKIVKQANALITFYSGKFITKEDAFFKGFTQEAGSSFTVPCTHTVTTVRYRKK